MRIIKLALKGSAYLLGRHAVISVLSFGVSVVLAIFLSPSDFGLFALTLPPVMAFILLSDLGLSAALIRTGRKDPGALASHVFWFQLLVAGVGFLIIIAASGFWMNWYALPESARRLLIFHSFVLLGMPSRNVSVAQMERKLLYQRVAMLEVIEAITAQCLVVVLAWRGFGPFSLLASPMVRAFGGGILAPVFAGWRPRLAMPKPAAVKSLLSFGVVYQSNHLVNFARDAVVPLVVGSVAGVAAAGYVSWATMVANYPAQVLFNVGRLFYPFFVKAAGDARRMLAAVRGVVGLTVWAAGLLSVPLFGLSDSIIRLLFPERWFPAIPLFYYFVPINLSLALLVPAAAYFNSVGKPGVRLKFAILGGVVLWAGTLFSVGNFGIFGFAASNVVMNLVELGMVVMLVRSVGRFGFPIRSLVSAFVLGPGLLAIDKFAGPLGWPGLLLAGAAGVLSYLAAAGRPWRLEA